MGQSRIPLDFHRPLFAQRDGFVFQGRHYAVGVEIPWRRLATSEHVIARIYGSGRIGHERYDSEEGTPPARPAPAAAPVESIPAVSAETSPAEPAADAQADPRESPVQDSRYAIEHIGGGWHRITLDGADVHRLRGRLSDAQKWCDGHPPAEKQNSK
ncbi:hypothetical protein HDG34_005867 [Paraburkholderia sp. HC6.4b]|uniref:hypothetical protein n=1 Tax=unclassified Paraburkholderia TaxID=2615204 RepID=UPI001620897F|nr:MULTISPECIES: hypothetical protein [unclassified Paraburkholderia]MBB5411901.1 hypothetical protein [Paraburkholderia sp. HC6.4b]MBB5450213.1 hypothetical protein [Paraburkholderia sp. Kb1A]